MTKQKWKPFTGSKHKPTTGKLKTTDEKMEKKYLQLESQRISISKI